MGVLSGTRPNLATILGAIYCRAQAGDPVRFLLIAEGVVNGIDGAATGRRRVVLDAYGQSVCTLTSLESGTLLAFAGGPLSEVGLFSLLRIVVAGVPAQYGPGPGGCLGRTAILVLRDEHLGKSPAQLTGIGSTSWGGICISAWCIEGISFRRHDLSKVVVVDDDAWWSILLLRLAVTVEADPLLFFPCLRGRGRRMKQWWSLKLSRLSLLALWRVVERILG
ncbi:hypothetical protein Ct61P_01609 [Colletotrichum tofieldiae]|nr:hypothetical protein Ct61P_01609 [Colletotrichum tofieldiae]